MSAATKYDRELYHSAIFWTWWWRSFLMTCLAILLTFDPENSNLMPVAAAASACCWIWAFIHRDLEVTCDETQDCGDHIDRKCL